MLVFFGFLMLSASENNVDLQEQRSISGIITDANTGDPLPGVSILIKGTTSGVITDVDGKYTLMAGSEDILIFSYIGYLSKELPVGEQTTINITLSPDIIGMDEVVVIGYGVQKKKLGNWNSLEAQLLMVIHTSVQNTTAASIIIAPDRFVQNITFFNTWKKINIFGQFLLLA
jgi:hypothetical protein